MSEFAKLDKTETALLLIEFQNEFVSDGGKLHEAVNPCMIKTNMLSNTQDLVSYCRQNNIKVIHAPITFTSNYKELSTTSYGIFEISFFYLT